MSSSQASSLMTFLTQQMRKKGSTSQYPLETANTNQEEAVEELAAELSALGTLQLRSLMLEERKTVGKYKDLFADTHKPEHTMQVDEVTSCQEPSAETAAPAANPGEALSIQLVPEFDEVTNQKTKLKLVVSVRATADVVKPANVALMAVVDKSGSMQGQKIELVKGTVDFLVEQLGEKDALGLVTYSNDAKRELPLLMMTPAAKVIARAVNDKIRVDNCTALYDGLMMAVKEHNDDIKAADDGNTRRVRSVFLCTDGLPNVGPSDAKTIVASMRAQLALLAAADEPISINTFGFGADHDPKLLQAIAEAGGGIYYYIKNDSQIPEAFGDALGGLLSVVACNVRINITTAAAPNDVLIGAVQSGGVVESVADSKKQACVKFSDFFADENREVLLELQLPQHGPLQDKQAQQLLKVEVTYTNPVTGALISNSQTLEVTRSQSPPAQQNRNELVATTVARFHVAEAVKVAGVESEAGRYEGAVQVLENAKKKIELEGAGEAEWVFIDQLTDMSKAVERAKTARTIQYQAAVTTSLTSYSYAMSNQRSAAPCFAPFAAAPAQGGMFGGAAGPQFGGVQAPLFGGVQVQAAAPGGGAMPALPPKSMQFMNGTSVMRQKMSSNAADYVSKKAKK